ncbi:DMT family transporter [Larkinella sp. VNQ87]|uniref:DMT family transporter n=1 Tax=Larkinella sp. VNQ87 TaxID=3400921 RepID=UPI003C07D970
MQKTTTADYLHLHFLVLIWGFTAILGLLISVSALTLVAYRTLLAALGLAVVLMVQKKMVAIAPADRLKLLATGLVIALHWALFFGAARVANASVCLAGMATGSLWTSLLEPLFFRRRLRLVEVTLGLVVMAGLYLIFRFELDRAVGLLMAVFSAMLAAVFTIINSRFTRRYSALTITFYEMCGAFGGSLVFLGLYLALGLEKPQALWPQPTDWIWISILALVCTVYAYSAAVVLMRKFSAFAINLTVNLEPVYGIMLAWLFFGDRERMTTGFYIGTLVILVAVLAYPVWSRKQDKSYSV